MRLLLLLLATIFAVRISADLITRYSFLYTSSTKTSTSACQPITVPDGTVAMKAVLYAGSGGQYNIGSKSLGGRGGGIASVVPVTAGLSYWVCVGGKGDDSSASGSCGAGAGGGGWPGGGNSPCGGGGGGATTLQTSSDPLAYSSRLVVAGAGGGGGTQGSYYTGANGGGLVGATALGTCSLPKQYPSAGCGYFTIGSKGGSQVEGGGAGGTPDSAVGTGYAGALGVGGSGDCCYNGGGGGGGYYGGGGGGKGGGGGGSSYSAPGSVLLFSRQGVTYTEYKGSVGLGSLFGTGNATVTFLSSYTFPESAAPTAVPTALPSLASVIPPSPQPTSLSTENPTAVASPDPSSLPTSGPTAATSAGVSSTTQYKFLYTSGTKTTTSACQAITVPDGTVAMKAVLYAGSGGQNVQGVKSLGGRGGGIASVVPVTPGTSYWVCVGGKGDDSSASGLCSYGGYGGWPGGGLSPCGGGGGGATTLQTSSDPLAYSSRLVVAGAGGGGGYQGYTGANGGGLVGASAQGICSISRYDPYAPCAPYNTIGAKGGSQIEGGGAGGTPGSALGVGSPGTPGCGGMGDCCYNGGGGGGGYYGGGGGAKGGGGGGSSYSAPGSVLLFSLQGVTYTTYVYAEGSRFGTGNATITFLSSYTFPDSEAPTAAPTAIPTALPSLAPVRPPSPQPTSRPSAVITAAPTALPSLAPVLQPSPQPTSRPSAVPTAAPTALPTTAPSAEPTSIPSPAPSGVPSLAPSPDPTMRSDEPTPDPTAKPTAPSQSPSVLPTVLPSAVLTTVPSAKPSGPPTLMPTAATTALPSLAPVLPLTPLPTRLPTALPSANPTIRSDEPTPNPTAPPTARTALPTAQRTSLPTALPSANPTMRSDEPTPDPTARPTRPSALPTAQRTGLPTAKPTTEPSAVPTLSPTPAAELLEISFTVSGLTLEVARSNRAFIIASVAKTMGVDESQIIDVVISVASAAVTSHSTRRLQAAVQVAVILNLPTVAAAASASVAVPTFSTSFASNYQLATTQVVSVSGVTTADVTPTMMPSAVPSAASSPLRPRSSGSGSLASLAKTIDAPFYIAAALAAAFAALTVVLAQTKGDKLYVGLVHRSGVFGSLVGSALAGAALASECVVMHGMLQSPAGARLGLAMLAARLVHLPAGLFIAARYLFCGGGGGSGSSASAPLLLHEAVARSGKLWGGVAVLGMAEVTVFRHLPWLASDFASRSGGYPNASVFMLCVCTKAVQSLVTVVCQGSYLSVVKAGAGGGGVSSDFQLFSLSCTALLGLAQGVQLATKGRALLSGTIHTAASAALASTSRASEGGAAPSLVSLSRPFSFAMPTTRRLSSNPGVAGPSPDPRDSDFDEEEPAQALPYFGRTPTDSIPRPSAAPSTVIYGSRGSTFSDGNNPLHQQGAARRMAPSSPPSS